ncbi:MAG TPA: type I glyceraldehyde-3-phosphate dehydrogenase [Fimbriimonadales bacterium]|nr:type I glyceraldehyde-3-phosphate dehydrogenase [Fimbriimonadales bacterium]
MAVKVGINGFGRIGRLTLRAILEKYPNDIEVVAINDITDPKTNAHLFQWDSTYGPFCGETKAGENDIYINGKCIRSFAFKDPAEIDWSSEGVEIVLEASGKFTDRENAQKHLRGSVKKVIISAPAKGEDLTVVLGVNEDMYDPAKHSVISNASCTTNCLAPMAKVLLDSFGIEKGFMTTVHAYTNDQRVQDQAHKDLRRARAAGQNIIPTTTGAAKAIGSVIPELKGKMNGFSLRVPVSTVSVVDLVVTLERNATEEEINEAMREASKNRMKGILDVKDEPLVSSDFIGNTHSCIIDSQLTMMLGEKMAKVVGWYDNEWGYACRCADLMKFLKERGL